MNSFNTVFRYLRKRDGYTQKDLAQKLDVAESTIGMWEQGRRMPERESLEGIADLFHVDLDFFLGRKPPAAVSGRRQELYQLMLELNPEEAEQARAFLKDLLSRRKK
jgi:transcriptional regulator with XRE-family HTH domain